MRTIFYQQVLSYVEKLSNQILLDYWPLANYRDDNLAEKALAVFSSNLVERGLAIARSCL